MFAQQSTVSIPMRQNNTHSIVFVLTDAFPGHRSRFLLPYEDPHGVTRGHRAAHHVSSGLRYCKAAPRADIDGSQDDDGEINN